MIYGAVVLSVMCLTVLTLQQLLDSNQFRYLFSILRKMGVEEKIERLVLKQLGVWFGIPIYFGSTWIMFPKSITSTVHFVSL